MRKWPIAENPQYTLSISMMRQWRMTSLLSFHYKWADHFEQGGRWCICKLLRRWRIISSKCADNYERGGVIDGSITSSRDFIPISGPVRDETYETVRWNSTFIHRWLKYPCMRIPYEWGASAAAAMPSCLRLV